MSTYPMIRLVAICLCLCMQPLLTEAAPIPPSQAPSLSSMLKRILPTVVNVRANIKLTDFTMLNKLQKERGRVLDPGEIPDTYLSVGSGVIVDADKGYIITNAHVITDAQIITVTLGDGHHYTAKLIGSDKPSDIALLQIKAKNLTAVSLDVSNTLQVGDYVEAVGNPFGLNQTVTSGIVSALGRTALGIENYENFIQTDAPINPGNSGGALFDIDGHLIGINTAILAPDRGNVGIGFAIPSNIVQSVMKQLIEFGNVKRGILGVGAQDLTPDLENAFGLPHTEGAAISMVKINSPAQKAGIQIGDVLTTVNGLPIKNANDVVNTVGFLRVDSKISLDILRANKHLALNATLTDPKALKLSSEAENPYFNGVALKNFHLLSPAHGMIEGVLVVAVEADSHAWQADLRPGDVIVSVSQTKTANLEVLKAVADKAKDALLVNVLRGDGAIFLVINKTET
jgi:serine protease Do